MIKIRCIKGSLAKEEFCFHTSKRISIGRSKKNFIRMEKNSKISRHHCILEIVPPSTVFLHDLGSRNGTSIGELHQKKISFVKVEEGCYLHSKIYVRVIDHIFEIDCGEEQTSTTCSKCNKSISTRDCANGKCLCADTVICRSCFEEQITSDKNFIDNLEILEKIDENSVALTYKARNVLSENTTFAIKIIQPASISNKKQHQKFLSELKIATKVKHPNIARYFGAGFITKANCFYIATEYVSGISLDEHLKKIQRPLNLQEAKSIFLQLLDALQHLHSRKLVHYDIKPTNVIIQENGKVRLLDFGLTKSFEKAGLHGLILHKRLKKTREYMAPEQCCDSSNIDPRSDIYSLAATFYFLLTQRNIFPGDTTNMLHKILFTPPIPIQQRDPSIPLRLNKTLMKALEKEPKNRYQTIAEFSEQLREDFQII